MPAKLIPIEDVPYLPWVPLSKKGKPYSRRSVFRWTKDGLKGVTLEYTKFGGRRCTTRPALVRFLRRTGKIKTPIDQACAPKHSIRRRKSAEQKAKQIVSPSTRSRMSGQS